MYIEREREIEMYVYTYLSLSIYIYIYIERDMLYCMICLFVYECMRVYIYIYIYTHIHTCVSHAHNIIANWIRKTIEQQMTYPCPRPTQVVVWHAEGGMLRLETLIELKFVDSIFSSSNLWIRVFRACPLVDIRQTVPCRAMRDKSSDLSRQYLSQQYPPPPLKHQAHNIIAARSRRHHLFAGPSERGSQNWFCICEAPALGVSLRSSQLGVVQILQHIMPFQIFQQQKLLSSPWLVLWKPIFPRVCFSGGVLFSHTPISLFSGTRTPPRTFV